MVNPYPDCRISRCPLCNRKTGQRKLPLVAHIEPTYFIALNYTCRYCEHCDLLIAHKHDIERLLTQLFRQYDPSAIGNEYLILGTLEKSTWREGTRQPLAVAAMQPHVADFAKYYEELRMTCGGWYPAGQEPPIMRPPASKEWVKVEIISRCE